MNANEMSAAAPAEPRHPKTAGKQRPATWSRSQFLKWLRKVHGWVGLWGAVIGLLFGVTGFLQNHRAVMRIATPAPVRTTIQMALPANPPQTAKAFAQWLATSMQLGDIRPRIMREPAQTVQWGSKEVMQPEHWEVRFAAPHMMIVAQYWKGESSATVTRNDNGWLTIIENMHKSTGVGIGWILLADSIAGSMILLSITGVILWTELNRRRTLGACIFGLSLIAMLVLGAQSM